MFTDGHLALQAPLCSVRRSFTISISEPYLSPIGLDISSLRLAYNSLAKDRPQPLWMLPSRGFCSSSTTSSVGRWLGSVQNQRLVRCTVSVSNSTLSAVDESFSTICVDSWREEETTSLQPVHSLTKGIIKIVQVRIIFNGRRTSSYSARSAWRTTLFEETIETQPLERKAGGCQRP